MSKAQQGAVGPTGSSGVPRPIAVPGKGPFSISRLPSHYCSPPRPLCSCPVCQEEGEGGRGEGRKREGSGRRGLGAGEAWGSLTSPQCLKAAAPEASIENAESRTDRAAAGRPVCCTLPPSPGLRVKQPRTSGRTAALSRLRGRAAWRGSAGTTNAVARGPVRCTGKRVTCGRRHEDSEVGPGGPLVRRGLCLVEAGD